MSTTHVPVSRRRFCAGACQAASCAAIATLFPACGGGGSSSSSPTSPSGGADVVTLGVASGRFTGSAVEVTVAGSALATVGGAVLVESVAGVFLVSRSSDSAFTAIDAVCSHESCTVTGAAGNIYVCPCHGSRYDRNGRVVQGPAAAALRQFPTTFAAGVVTIAV